MIIIGQAPGPTSDPAEPLSGASGRRLAALCGLPLAAFLAAFDRRNVLPAHPGRSGKGDAFPLAAARPVARRMLGDLAGARVVALGKPVASVLGLRGVLFRWQASRTGFRYALAPHPSGVSHWWNDPVNVRRARRFWRSVARRLR